jgi:hypothetical protein
MRFGAALLVVMVAFVSLAARPTAAQTVTTDQLAAAALSGFDLSEFDVVQDGDLMAPQGFAAAFLRSFVNTQDEGSLLLDVLLVPGPNLPLNVIRPLVASGMVFQGFHDATKQQIANYLVTGQLGIGDADQSAVWNAFDPQSRRWNTWYADAFLQGRVLSVMLYVTAADAANPDTVAGYARLQDAKLLSTDALPPDLTGGPGAAVAR